MSAKPDLVVFSHLRWDFVFQRPQHLLSRFAADRQVLFIEEPIYRADIDPSWELQRPMSHVLVARLHTPLAAPGFHDDHVATFHELLPELLTQENMHDYTVWFYTPM